jgi:hypothetical protein
VQSTTDQDTVTERVNQLERIVNRMFGTKSLDEAIDLFGKCDWLRLTPRLMEGPSPVIDITAPATDPAYVTGGAAIDCEVYSNRPDEEHRAKLTEDGGPEVWSGGPLSFPSGSSHATFTIPAGTTQAGKSYRVEVYIPGTIFGDHNSIEATQGGGDGDDSRGLTKDTWIETVICRVLWLLGFKNARRRKRRRK